MNKSEKIQKAAYDIAVKVFAKNLKLQRKLSKLKTTNKNKEGEKWQ